MPLTELEKLHDYAYMHKIDIYSTYLKSEHRGCCVVSNGRYAISLNTRVVDTRAEELCTLAEEIGHVEAKAVLPFDDYLCPEYKHWLKRKNEILALRYAIQRLLPPAKIQAAISKGNRGVCGIARFCGVTEEFVVGALRYYERKRIRFYVSS